MRHFISSLSLFIFELFFVFLIPKECFSQDVASDISRNLAIFEKDCKQIGFTPQTEKFGECVLELHRRSLSSSNVKHSQIPRESKKNQDKFLTECIQMGFQEGTSDLNNCVLSLRRQENDLNLYQQQLQIQQKQLAEVEKANRLAATQRLFELADQGFAMAAGNTSKSSGSSARNSVNTIIPISPSPLQFVTPNGNRYTCSYSGVQLICR